MVSCLPRVSVASEVGHASMTTESMSGCHIGHGMCKMGAIRGPFARGVSLTCLALFDEISIREPYVYHSSLA